MSPCFKKGDKSEKENYRPISILSNLSKDYEKLIYHQTTEFTGKKFKICHWLSKKTQCTIRTTKNDRKLEIQLNKRNKISVIIMNLSKAFDTFNHHLLFAKIKA